MDQIELMVKRRAGQLKKPLGFSLSKELRDISQARKDYKICKLDAKPVDFD